MLNKQCRATYPMDLLPEFEWYLEHHLMEERGEINPGTVLLPFIRRYAPVDRVEALDILDALTERDQAEKIPRMIVLPRKG